MRTNLIIFIVMFFGFFNHNNSSANLKLPSLFSDNMLLQQKSRVKIWGKATSGNKISVTASWKASGTTIADSIGNWQVYIQTPKAGGPFTIDVSSQDSIIRIHNVLIGEVWLCSGQSNMEMPLEGWPPDTIMNSKKEIESANKPDIRLFIVTHEVSGRPLEDCSGKWKICSPSSVRQFSATGYFFGKKLNEKLQVPVGLIESTWGGTPVESWIPLQAIEKTNEFKTEINNLRELVPNLGDYIDWLKKRQTIDVKEIPDTDKWKNLSFNDEMCSSKDFDDLAWPAMTLPQKFEAVIGEFDGVLWYRKDIELSKEMGAKDLILSLGPIDDMDQVYFNGHLVGAGEIPGIWQKDRVYNVPATIVLTGKNNIAIRVLDLQGGGGVWGKPAQMKLSVMNDPTVTPVQLAGQWKYLPTAELTGNKFYLFDVKTREFFSKSRPKFIDPGAPSVLYNGMIHPLMNYQIKGVIWYQGESNVGRADQYARLFPLMINEWRNLWKNDKLPFYYVQIAPYQYSDKNSFESAALREAQSSALSLHNTGMVVALDLGMIKTIHPPYKLEVGERLARLAFANTYNMKVPFSGPEYKSMKIEGNTIKLQFEYIEGGLVAKDGELNEFEIAGIDGKYVKAVAKIIDNEVIVSSSEINEPVSVRYCWKDIAEASLFNKAGLPASVFRTKK